MTNALQLLSNGNAELSELELLILQEETDDENAYDLIPTRITIAPGGINQFATSDGETIKELLCIVPVSQKARAYWPGKGSDQPPLCTSADGVVGTMAANPSDMQIEAALHSRATHAGVRALAENKPIPKAIDCATCPLSQWGSADEGAGKGCKEMRRLVVIIEGWATPALLTLPPTSIKAWDGFCSAQRAKKSAYFAQRAKLVLEKARSAGGDPYSVLSVQAAGSLAIDEVKAVAEVRRQYAEFVRSLPVDADDYATGAPVLNDEEIAPF